MVEANSVLCDLSVSIAAGDRIGASASVPPQRLIVQPEGRRLDPGTDAAKGDPRPGGGVRGRSVLQGSMMGSLHDITAELPRTGAHRRVSRRSRWARIAVPGFAFALLAVAAVVALAAGSVLISQAAVAPLPTSESNANCLPDAHSLAHCLADAHPDSHSHSRPDACPGPTNPDPALPADRLRLAARQRQGHAALRAEQVRRFPGERPAVPRRRGYGHPLRRQRHGGARRSRPDSRPGLRRLHGLEWRSDPLQEEVLVAGPESVAAGGHRHRRRGRL